MSEVKDIIKIGHPDIHLEMSPTQNISDQTLEEFDISVFVMVGPHRIDLVQVVFQSRYYKNYYWDGESRQEKWRTRTQARNTAVRDWYNHKSFSLEWLEKLMKGLGFEEEFQMAAKCLGWIPGTH